MVSVNRRVLEGEVFNDVRCLSTDEKPLDVLNGSTLIEIDTGNTYMFNAATHEWIGGSFAITGLGQR